MRNKYKKGIIWSILMVMLLSSSVCYGANMSNISGANQTITTIDAMRIYINNKYIHFSDYLREGGNIFIREDSLYVPLYLFGKIILDSDIAFDEETKVSRIYGRGDWLGWEDWDNWEMVMYGETNEVYVSGKYVQMDKTPIIWGVGQYDQRPYIPLRAALKVLGIEPIVIKEGQITHIFVITKENLKPILLVDPPANVLGEMTGTASSNHKENMDAIRKYLGPFSHSDGVVAFNASKVALHESNFLISGPQENDKFEIEIDINSWESEDIKNNPMTSPYYKVSNYAIKEILKFYLPQGYKELYKIIDDGFNGKWPQNVSYLNKDLKTIIGCDGREVRLRDINNNFTIEIGPKNK